MIFVGHNLPEKDDPVFQHFESVSTIDSVQAPYSRQLGDKIAFFRNADDSCAAIIRGALFELKKQFRR